jgi:hypothetical protein
MFTEFRTLGTTLFLEAYDTIYYNLPVSNALLSYTQIQQDLITVANVKQVTYAFVAYIAAHDDPAHERPEQPHLRHAAERGQRRQLFQIARGQHRRQSNFR